MVHFPPYFSKLLTQCGTLWSGITGTLSIGIGGILWTGIVTRLHEAFHFKKKLRELKKKEKVTFVNMENIIRSIHDKLPMSKFAGDTVAKFKGKTFLFMAREYPEVFIKFLAERKELIISKDVLEHLISVAKHEIKNRLNT